MKTRNIIKLTLGLVAAFLSYFTLVNNLSYLLFSIVPIILAIGIFMFIKRKDIKEKKKKSIYNFTIFLLLIISLVLCGLLINSYIKLADSSFYGVDAIAIGISSTTYFTALILSIIYALTELKKQTNKVTDCLLITIYTVIILVHLRFIFFLPREANTIFYRAANNYLYQNHIYILILFATTFIQKAFLKYIK